MAYLILAPLENHWRLHVLYYLEYLTIKHKKEKQRKKSHSYYTENDMVKVGVWPGSSDVTWGPASCAECLG